MTLNRVYKIAQTGQIEEPNAVDNIMAQYQPKQEQGGFWNGLKNFAKSDTGRMLIGGLGTAAAVGLSGGNGRDALRYGLMGAGNTMNSIDARKRYRDKLMKEQQERADRMAEAEKLRQHQLTMQANNIQANKDAADLAFERRMQEINEGIVRNQRQEEEKLAKTDAYIDSLPYSAEQKQIMKVQARGFTAPAAISPISSLTDEYLNPNTTEERREEIKPLIQGHHQRANWINSLTPKEQLSFTDATKGVSNLSSATNLPAETKNAIAAGYGLETNFIDTPKKYASGQLGLVQARMDETGEDFATASHNVGIMSPEEKQALELKKMEREKELDNEYKLGFELFKSELPTQAHREALNEAEARGVPVNVIYQEKYDMAQAELAYKKSQTAKNEADTAGKLTANQFIGAEKRAGINQTLANTDKTRAEIPFVPQKMTADIAHTKSQTAKNMYDINPVQPGTVVNGVTLTGNKTYDTEALKQKAKNESEREKSQLARTRAETQAIEGIKALQQLVDDDSLGNFNQSSWNIYPSDATRLAQGKLSGAIAAIAPLAIQRLKDAGVSGINTMSEFMRYVGLPDNPTSKQIEGALPLIMSSIGMTDTGYQSTGGSDLSSISTDDLMGML